MGKRNKKHKNADLNHVNKTSKSVCKEQISSAKLAGPQLASPNTPNKQSSEKKEQQNWMLRFFKWLREKQIISKIFVICFALAIFSYVYFESEASDRATLSYFGLLLSMIAVYVEILVIRDHLWVVEGSLRESRKWRDSFFSPSTLRQQKFRKIIVLLFALVIFTFAYRLKVFPGARASMAYIVSILMITMVYYEILAIRDEVSQISRAMQIAALVDAKEENKDK